MLFYRGYGQWNIILDNRQMDVAYLKNEVIKSPIQFESAIDDGEGDIITDIVAEFTAKGIKNVSEGVYEETIGDDYAKMDLNEKTLFIKLGGSEEPGPEDDWYPSPSYEYEIDIDDEQLKALREWAEKNTTPETPGPKTGGRKSKRRGTKKRAAAARKVRTRRTRRV